jgi:hypothetical protein
VPIERDEVGFLRVTNGRKVKAPIDIGGRVFFGAPFFFGEEASVEVPENREFVLELAGGNIATESLENA